MSKETRGTKRLCEACGAKFYDLGRSPIVCPMCEAELVVEEPKAKPEPRAEVETPAAPAPAEEPKPKAKPEAESSDSGGAELISLDEAAAEEESVEDADLADIETDEENIPAAGEEDVFLEDDEDESGSDVSGIIGGPIDTKEES
ncbi:MAG: TIGR02300 family protein [Hyphomicrobiaceae bacterium]|nr:TIGR02300 family protein [Hyphomicrobiaceae bacterium]